MDTIRKTVKGAELNTKIMSVALHFQTFTII